MKTRIDYYDSIFPGERTCQYAQSDLDKVALLLNQRPGKTLNYANPAEEPGSIVALTD